MTAQPRFRTSLITAAALSAAALAATAPLAVAGWKEGAPALKSAGPLAFGPDGVLFVSDPAGAQIVAVLTGDTKPASDAVAFDVSGVDKKVAALLGTTPERARITDLAVNPESRRAYLSVTRGQGPEAVPVIVRAAAGGELEIFSLDDVKYDAAALPNAPAPGEVRRGRRSSNPRMESITDLGYAQGKVFVAGLSNEDFASTLRTIPFPFDKVDRGAGIEIYHGAHGKLETHSPVRTFTTLDIGGSPHLLAAYTCTPLVTIPVADLKAGAQIRGTTIAELGNRNRPLDMIRYRKDGVPYVLVANSARGVMKLAESTFAGAEGINERVERGATKGVSYETIEAWKGVLQLDRLDDSLALVVRESEDGLNLESLPLP